MNLVVINPLSLEFCERFGISEKRQDEIGETMLKAVEYCFTKHLNQQPEECVLQYVLEQFPNATDAEFIIIAVNYQNALQKWHETYTAQSVEEFVEDLIKKL